MDRGAELSQLISNEQLICPQDRRTVVALLHLAVVLGQRSTPASDWTERQTEEQVDTNIFLQIPVWIWTRWWNRDVSERTPVAPLLRPFVAGEDHWRYARICSARLNFGFTKRYTVILVQSLLTNYQTNCQTTLPSIQSWESVFVSHVSVFVDASKERKQWFVVWGLANNQF